MTTPKCPLCGKEARRYSVGGTPIGDLWECYSDNFCRLSCVPLTLDEIRRLTRPTDEQIAAGVDATHGIHLLSSNAEIADAFRTAAYPNEHGE